MKPINPEDKIYPAVETLAPFFKNRILDRFGVFIIIYGFIVEISSQT